MVAVASSSGSVGGGIGIALGAATHQRNIDSELDLQRRKQAESEAATRAHIALQEQALKTQLGYKDAANQAADIFGNLNPSQDQGAQPEAAQGPLPEGFAPTPQGIADGTVGSAHPDRQKAEWQGLEQYHASLMQKGLAVAGTMDPEMRREMFGGLREQMQLHAQKLHANQLSATMHDSIVSGALDPTDPSTGMRVPDDAVRQQALELSDRVKNGDPTAAQAYDQLASRALESHVTINQRVAMGAGAQRELDQARVAGKPVSDIAVALADQLKSGRIDLKTFQAEWPAALAGVPGPTAIKAMQAQAKADVDAARAEVDRMRAKYEPAKIQAETNRAQAQADAGGFAPRNGESIKLPGSGSTTYNLSPAQARVRGIAEAKSVAGDQWKAMDPKAKSAAIEEATAHYKGEPPRGATDSLMQSRAIPFEQGAPVKLSDSVGGSDDRDAFLKQWRADNPKGTVDEAKAAWSTRKK